MRLLEALEHDIASCKNNLHYRMATDGVRFLKGSLKVSTKLHALLSCADIISLGEMEFEEGANIGFSIFLDFYVMGSETVYSKHRTYSIDDIKNWITLQV